tara:strand:- start:1053 stop:2099 length:1047 start_codon:yes stop_codon:yes gene_type:complete
MYFLFSDGKPNSKPVPAEHPNGDALGVNGGGIFNGRWRFSQVKGDKVIGTTVQNIDGKSKAHLSLGETEITGYHAGMCGDGMVGTMVTDCIGEVHEIVQFIGHGEVSAGDCADILSDFFPQYDKNDPMFVVRRANGKSGAGTGYVVTIHGERADAGAKTPVVDEHMLTNLGGRISNQLKVISRSRKSEGGRLGMTGEQIMDSLLNQGRELVLTVAKRGENGSMDVRFFNVGAILREQVNAGIDVMGPVGVPMQNGKPVRYKVHGEDMTGREVEGGGRVETHSRPFYRKYARGGTKTKRIAPRSPMYFSVPAIDSFLKSLPTEKRERMATGWMPFHPTLLPEWIGDCIY